MGRPPGEYQPVPEIEQRERRRNLRPLIEAIQAGEPLDLAEETSIEDARKVERNAIAAIYIDRSLMLSQSRRSERGRYGLLHASSVTDLHHPLYTYNRPPEEWTLTDYQRSFKHELLTTLRFDLNETMTRASAQNEPAFHRLISLIDKVGPRAFIESGMMTAVQAIEMLYEALPPGHSPAEQAEIVRNSFPLLARIASEHLNVGARFLNTLKWHKEYMEVRPVPGGSERLQFSAAGELAYQVIKKESNTLDRAKTVATGCPALVRGKQGTAIEGLLRWYTDSYQALCEDIAK